MPYNIVRLGDETRIHTSTSGPQYGIQWVELPDGRFVMLWYGDGDQPGQGDTSGYFQQLFDANGQKIGSETRVNDTIDGSVGSEAFSVSLPIGGWGSLWKSSNGDPLQTSNIYFRPFGADGVPGEQVRICLLYTSDAADE